MRSWNDSHWWSFCSSLCCAHLWPDQSQQFSSHYPPSPERSWPPGLYGYTKHREERSSPLIMCLPQTSFNSCERNVSNTKSFLFRSVYAIPPFFPRCYFHGQKVTHLHRCDGVVVKGCEILNLPTQWPCQRHMGSKLHNVSGHQDSCSISSTSTV